MTLPTTAPLQPSTTADPPAAPPSTTDQPVPGNPATPPIDDPEVLRRELAEARREESRYRLRAKELEDAERARSEAAMTEQEKRDQRIKDLELENARLVTEGKERRLHVAAVDAAVRLGFRSPEVAIRLIDSSAVEYDQNSEPTNVEALLREVLVKEPYLGKTGASGDFGGGTRGTTPPQTPDMDALLRAAARG
jgi:hypothetical protein